MLRTLVALLLFALLLAPCAAAEDEPASAPDGEAKDEKAKDDKSDKQKCKDKAECEQSTEDPTDQQYEIVVSWSIDSQNPEEWSVEGGRREAQGSPEPNTATTASGVQQVPIPVPGPIPSCSPWLTVQGGVPSVRPQCLLPGDF